MSNHLAGCIVALSVLASGVAESGVKYTSSAQVVAILPEVNGPDRNAIGTCYQLGLKEIVGAMLSASKSLGPRDELHWHLSQRIDDTVCILEVWRE